MAKYIKLFESFIDEEDWNETFPEVSRNQRIPNGELYRWLNPELVYEYFSKGTIEWSGVKETGIDPMGNEVQADGIPFFEGPEYFYGFVEPFVRIVLDRSKLEEAGYTIHNPHRDPGEVRIKENIQNWFDYLILVQVNRDEFVITEDNEREMEIPFKNRIELWDLITKNTPTNKIVISNDDLMS